MNYTVTNARVGQMTDYDKLTLEVWTNGASSPATPWPTPRRSSKEQLQIFINFQEQDEVVSAPRSTEAPAPNENLFKSVEFELSVRSANCLPERQHHVHRRAGAEDRGHLLKTKNFRPQVP